MSMDRCLQKPLASEDQLSFCSEAMLFLWDCQERREWLSALCVKYETDIWGIEALYIHHPTLGGLASTAVVDTARAA
jgi:hypothetical protein